MKKLLKILGILVVLVLIIAAVAPKEFKMEKEIIINKPVAEVFNYVKLAENGNNWNPWLKKDPNMVRGSKGVDGTVGYTTSWSSNNSEVGTGEEEITNIADGERIDFELRFKKPMEAINNGYFTTEAISENQTKVIWGMNGRTPFPFNIMCFLMRGKAEAEMAQGLSNLKMVLELETPAPAEAPATPAAE
jgi:uncharacterized protein YndB with AHSA1/START domain